MCYRQEHGISLEVNLPAGTKGLRASTNGPGVFFCTVGVMDYLILVFKCLYGLIFFFFTNSMNFSIQKSNSPISILKEKEEKKKGKRNLISR